MSITSSIIATAHAQTVNATAFGSTVQPIITYIVQPVITVLFAVAVVVFVYGIVQMIIYGDDADKRTKGKTSILSGLIGIFIMLSAWGIIWLISNTVSQFKQ